MKSSTNSISRSITADKFQTLPKIFQARIKKSAEKVAYKYYDQESHTWKVMTWRDIAKQVSYWQAAFLSEEVQAGDKVAIMLPNCCEWIIAEQAALSLGLVIVPLFSNDRAENVSYILQDASVKILILHGTDHLEQLESIRSQLDGLVRLVSVQECEGTTTYSRLLPLAKWLRYKQKSTTENASTNRTSISDEPESIEPAIEKALDQLTSPDQLATIVYTSGTTGRPKGVMLSHKNIICNAYGAIKLVPISADDIFLSFLPLSHMLERTLGYYIPMITGATVAFSRSVADLGEDLLTIRPTLLISVPRIYERVFLKINSQLQQKSKFARWLFQSAVDIGWQYFEYKQGRKNWQINFLFKPLLDLLVAKKIRSKLGGRLKIAICGGAPLASEVARTFIGLGLHIVQGYGLTETSPIISGNPLDNNDPSSVGLPLVGVEVKIGEAEELLTRGENVMLGYWNNANATRDLIDNEGWLHTGDKARIDKDHIYITGRLKEIIVLANGEKIAPADLEMAISMDSLIDQVLVVGDTRPFLSAIVVLNQDEWKKTAREINVSADFVNTLGQNRLEEIVLEHIQDRTRHFPAYACIHKVVLCLEQWTIENGLMTPTMKLRREQLLEQFQQTIDALYLEHESEKNAVLER